MIFLNKFRFPSADKEDRFLAEYYKKKPWAGCHYPFGVLTRNQLHMLDMDDITVLYGGNGSGKSTALNVIGNKLGIYRASAYNKGNLQKEYLELCTYEPVAWSCQLNKIAHFISSDDIFKYMQDTRVRNDHYDIRSNAVANEILRIKSGRLTVNGQDAMRHLDFESGENMDTFMQLYNMKKQSHQQYIRSELGCKTQTYSNGETGFMWFAEHIVPDSLYLLDEPENSLSCELQMKLAEFIEQSVRYCGCQFVIATHSPFILSLGNAKIYNFDANPVTVSHWWELPNMQIMYRLFKQYDREFSVSAAPAANNH